MATNEKRDMISVPDAPPFFVRFERRAPSAQTAVDVFRGRWASDLAKVLSVDGTGPNHLFDQDLRPQQLAAAFGVDGSVTGMKILEIGPLEAAHTYLLERLGASSIIAVESNVEAWLKCLIVKNLLNLDKSKFVVGDAAKYLEQSSDNFDIVMCSGVLYHLSDPLALVENICARTNKCFVWTHYYDQERHPVNFEKVEIERSGLKTTYWSHDYGNTSHQFWGGIGSNACWMQKADILQAFRHFGLENIAIVNDFYDHPNGPSFTFAASR